MVREVEGQVVEAEVADLDADGSPEIYVYVQSAGSGSYGSLVAFAANKKKSLSDIYLPPIADDPKASKGYMGHDEFRVVENTLVRRFPVYRDGDANAKPTGGMRGRFSTNSPPAKPAGTCVRTKSSNTSNSTGEGEGPGYSRSRLIRTALTELLTSLSPKLGWPCAFFTSTSSPSSTSTENALGSSFARRTSRIFRATAFSLVPLAIGTATSKAATASERPRAKRRRRSRRPISRLRSPGCGTCSTPPRPAGRREPRP